MPVCLRDGERKLMINDLQLRKAEHIKIALLEDVEYNGRPYWEDVELVHTALPEIDLSDVQLSTSFLGWNLSYPFCISALTGGCPEAWKINKALAESAKYFNICMQTGSIRAYLESEDELYTYKVVREVSDSIPVMLNIGIPQAKTNLEKIKKIVELMRADACVIHLNFLQEAVMVEGEPYASEALSTIEKLVKSLSIPVIVKETGCGISKELAEKLRDIGCAAIDVSGKGGTSMALIEKQRAKWKGNKMYERIAQTFSFWGIPTPVCIYMARDCGIPLIGGGGIKTGLDAAKAIALGADVVAVGRPLLLCAIQGLEKIVEYLETFFMELRIALFLTGSKNCSELKSKKTIITGKTREWIQALEKE